MNKKGTFGVVKPLPGQAAYKVSETDNLEKEAKEMEMRLKLLQERMQQQRIDDENLVRPGGARWNGARLDKGSVLSYGKDIQEKYKKKRDAEGGGDPALWPSSLQSSKKSKASETKAKDVSQWNKAEVSNWLNSLSLGQYVDVFESNDISGAVLLDLSLEDLDYLNVKALGHRKLILKGIEDLRKNKTTAIDLKNSSSSNDQRLNSNPKQLFTQSVRLEHEPTKAERLESLAKSMTVESLSKQVGEMKKSTHWSDAEPLSKNAVAVSHQTFANAADDDVYDEEAERIAFQEAVMEWRRANNGSKENSSVNQAVWENPFAQQSSERGIVRKESMKKLDDSNGSFSQEDSASSVADVLLQEEAERIEFMKAVEEWRNAGSKAKDSHVQIVTSQTGGGGPIITGKMLAENLAKELEAEQEKATQKYKLEIERARQMQEARRNEALLTKSADSQDHSNTPDTKDINPIQDIENAMAIAEEEPEISGSYFDESMIRDTSHRSKKVETPSIPASIEQNSEDVLSEFDNDEELSQKNDLEFQRHADIKLLESQIGHTSDVSEGDYIVEELSDDD